MCVGVGVGVGVSEWTNAAGMHAMRCTERASGERRAMGGACALGERTDESEVLSLALGPVAE